MKRWIEELSALVRSEALAMEQSGEISKPVLKAIYERGLFKLLVPAELDGHMLPLPDALRIFERASRIDGSFGWLVTIGAGGGYFAAFMEPGVCRKLLFRREAVIAGSGYPAGEARRVEGGFRVNGRWKYISGATYATLFTVNCVLRDGKGDDDGRIRSFILMPDQVKVLRDWKAFGLKATGSHSILVEEALVPKHMTFDIAEPYPVYRDPLFRYPFLPFALSSFAAVALGIARHFLEESRKLVEAHRDIWTSQRLKTAAEAVTRMAGRLEGTRADFTVPSMTPGTFTVSGLCPRRRRISSASGPRRRPRRLSRLLRPFFPISAWPASWKMPPSTGPGGIYTPSADMGCCPLLNDYDLPSPPLRRAFV